MPRSRYVGLSPSEKRKLYRYISKVREWCKSLGGELDVVEEPEKRFVIRCVFSKPVTIKAEVKGYITSSESRYIHKPEKAKYLLTHLVIEGHREDLKEWNSLFFREEKENVKGIKIREITIFNPRYYRVELAFSPDIKLRSVAKEVDFVIDVSRNELYVGIEEVS